MRHEQMQRVFERHRDAEAARDYDAILATFVGDCFLETHPLGLRSEGRAAARAAYEGYFTAFPDLAPGDANVTPFRDGLMAGESIYFDLATLCEQANLPLDEVRAGAKARAEALRSGAGG